MKKNSETRCQIKEKRLNLKNLSQRMIMLYLYMNMCQRNGLVTAVKIIRKVDNLYRDVGKNVT